MLVYMPIAGYTAFYSFFILNELSKINKRFIIEGVVEEMPKKKKPKKAIPTDIFQSFKEVKEVKQ